MSKSITVSDEQFAVLEGVAKKAGTTLEKLVDAWVDEAREWGEGVTYSISEWEAYLDKLDQEIDSASEK